MKLRTRRRRREESIDQLLPRFASDGGRMLDGRESVPASDTLVEEAETRARVRAAIARLPERYRAVLLLRDIEERDGAEVAEALGITPQAVKTRLHRARQALRALLVRE